MSGQCGAMAYRCQIEFSDIPRSSLFGFPNHCLQSRQSTVGIAGFHQSFDCTTRIATNASFRSRQKPQRFFDDSAALFCLISRHLIITPRFCLADGCQKAARRMVLSMCPGSVETKGAWAKAAAINSKGTSTSSAAAEAAEAAAATTRHSRRHLVMCNLRTRIRWYRHDSNYNALTFLRNRHVRAARHYFRMTFQFL